MNILKTRTISYTQFFSFALASLVFLLSPNMLSASPESSAQPQELIALPGSLNQVPVFNSNCPEVVLAEGILLSTLSTSNVKNKSAHLNYQFDGEFDVFMHHIANGKKSGHMEDLVIGLIARNKTSKSIELQTLQAASFLSQPDAPFGKLPKITDNTKSGIYAGPGDRVAQNILLNKSQKGWKSVYTVKPNNFLLLKTLSIPVSNLVPPLNGRNTLIKFRSNGPIELAAVALFKRKNKEGIYTTPKQREFIDKLLNGGLVEPRGLKPSKPGSNEPFRYGRVSGVSIGSKWLANNSKKLNINNTDATYSMPISSLIRGTFGSGQIQTSKLVRRYKDTAYSAHGNYGVLYDINLPIVNKTKEEVTIKVRFDCPLKSDQFQEQLKFLNPPSSLVFFRGSVNCVVSSKQGKKESGTYHVVLHKGEKGPILSRFNLGALQSANLKLQMVYPADSTPPQVVSIVSSSRKND